MPAAVDLLQRECQDGPTFISNAFLYLEDRLVRVADLWIYAPRGGGIFINRFFDCPILLIEIRGGILQENGFGRGGIGLRCGFNLEFGQVEIAVVLAARAVMGKA